MVEIFKEDLKIRIGINTGFCTVGNFGSNDRVDYTAIGSSVNLASRLEHAALPGTILVSEETFLLMKEHFSFAKEKKIDVKGLGRKISCHEVDIEDGFEVVASKQVAGVIDPISLTASQQASL